MAYATAAQLKTYLGITSSGDDSLLSDLIDRAQAIIEQYTRRTFEAAADSTRYFDAAEDVDGATLLLDEDLCAITSIINGDGVAVASGEYVTEPRNETPYYAIRLLSSSNKAWEYTDDGDPENAISITGRWAYSTTPPNDIVHATIRLAAFLYRQKESNADIDRPITTADGGMILPSAIPADVRALLDRYRKLV